MVQTELKSSSDVCCLWHTSISKILKGIVLIMVAIDVKNIFLVDLVRFQWVWQKCMASMKLAVHHSTCTKLQKCTTNAAVEQLQTETGIKYSTLIELTYFDTIRFTVIAVADPGIFKGGFKLEDWVSNLEIFYAEVICRECTDVQCRHFIAADPEIFAEPSSWDQKKKVSEILKVLFRNHTSTYHHTGAFWTPSLDRISHVRLLVNTMRRAHFKGVSFETLKPLWYWI